MPDNLTVYWRGGSACLVNLAFAKRCEMNLCNAGVGCTDCRSDKIGRSHALNDSRHGRKRDYASIGEIAHATWIGLGQNHQHPPSGNIQPDLSQLGLYYRIVSAG